MRINRGPVFVAPLLLIAVACAPADEGGESSDTTLDSSSLSAEASADDECAVDSLPLETKGQLTIGTDSPAFEPWFVNNDPTNGKGFESAVAYALAEQMGFTEGQVTWVKVPFNTSYAPGAKKFDFDINQISITPERAKVVDFSEGYYSAAQAVIAPKDAAIADATTLSELKDVKLGAQTGTTSLTAIRDVIQPTQDPLVFDDTNAAKQALSNGQVDAIIADLPTAFYITAVEIPSAKIVGQFQPTAGDQEEFGLLFEKGSELLPCVNKALADLETSGELDAIEQTWLAEAAKAPVLD